jgi:hypothetical protein
MAHEDEVVKPEREVPSEAIAEAQLRHERAKNGDAQDRKQAAVEEAHALSTRPDGSYAQLHEGRVPTLAVADPNFAEKAKAADEENREQVESDMGEPQVLPTGGGAEPGSGSDGESTRKSTAKK